MGRQGLLLLAALLPCLPAEAAEPWLRLRTPHFEVLTTARERDGREAILRFERLRGLFLAQAALSEGLRGPVRVYAFRSAREYAPYRLTESDDAYYAGAPGRDYIVLSSIGRDDWRTAAHEYAHLIARHEALELPAWLAEGLAEVYSTVRFESGQAVIGGPNLERIRQLRHGAWLPLADVMAAPAARSYPRQQSHRFYAESWALTHMLMFSPAYGPRFGALIAKFRGNVPARTALTEFYGKSLAEVERDIRAWIAQPRLPSMTVREAGSEPGQPVQAEAVTPFDADLALAELLAVIGRQEQARAAYLRLEASRPANAEVQAALGRIALALGQRTEARERYRRAVALGVRDARLCYDYATLAQDAGLPESDVVEALDRALALDPALDDARYTLALVHMNADRYDSAFRNFQALHHVPERRAFAYHSALAYTQDELGMHEDAVRSANEAGKHAHTEEEREHASELAWIAQSELVVQLSSGGSGMLRRIPRRDGREIYDWNPFITPGDRIERTEGYIGDLECAASGIRLTVLAPAGPLVLNMPDPGRVQVRKANAGAFEFTCGSEAGPKVLVEYAVIPNPEDGVTGVLRGIELR